MRCTRSLGALLLTAGVCMLSACATPPAAPDPFTATDEQLAVPVTVAETPAAPVWFGSISPSALMAHKQVESFKERKFHDLIRQGTDFSCGAAAVATIFNYAYGRHTNETQVLVNMLKVADQNIVRTKGFSLLDMKRYVEAIGMRGEGYEVPFESLYELRVPAIVLLDIRGYKHFVVLRKARDGYVQIGDPALGNRLMWRDEFEKAWNHIVFAILGDNYDENNILAHPAEPLSARRLYAMRSPIYNAEAYDLGLIRANQFTF